MFHGHVLFKWGIEKKIIKPAWLAACWSLVACGAQVALREGCARNLLFVQAASIC